MNRILSVLTVIFLSLSFSTAYAGCDSCDKTGQAKIDNMQLAYNTTDDEIAEIREDLGLDDDVIIEIVDDEGDEDQGEEEVPVDGDDMDSSDD